jgi:hypothetical protein
MRLQAICATMQTPHSSRLRSMRLVACLVLLVAIAACAAPAPAVNEAGAAVPAAPAKPACQPEPFCYRDCLRGYQPGYCRLYCGC